MYKPAAVTFLRGSRAATGVLAVLLCLPLLAAFFTDHEARANWEKRQLASWSSLWEADSAKQFFARLEDYLDDHIGFALELNRIYRQAQFHLFGDSPIANVDIGEDGFVFLNAHNTNKTYGQIIKLCTPHLSHVGSTHAALETIAGVLAQRQISMTFAVVPSKPLLYADRLPETVPQYLRTACRELDPKDSMPGQLVQRAANASHGVYYPIAQMRAMRDEEAFYPPQNFHADSMINHKFSAGLLRQLGIEPGDSYSAGAHLADIRADITMLGFPRRVPAWRYPYPAHRVKATPRQPDWVLDYYSRARDYGTYRTAEPASERIAVLLSNSFGAFFARHLAPGFRTLYHVNLNNLTADEASPFFEALLNETRPSDVIYLVHDGSLPNLQLTLLADAIAQ